MKKIIKTVDRIKTIVATTNLRWPLAYMICPFLFGVGAIVVENYNALKAILIIQSVMGIVITLMFIVSDSLREYFTEFSFHEQKRYYELSGLIHDMVNLLSVVDRDKIKKMRKTHELDKDSFFESNKHLNG